MTDLLRDLRFGLRLLAGGPVFATTAVLVLAIGISSNTLIFSAVDALLLRQLPVTRPNELVRLTQTHPSGFVVSSFPSELCKAISEETSIFSEVLCQGQVDPALLDRENTERVRVHLVSSNFFSTLGVGAQLGRVLLPGDETAEVMPAVLSHAFWERRFQRDPGIIGRNLTLNGYPLVVVGVSAKGFNGLTVETSPDIRAPATAERWFGGESTNSAATRSEPPIYAQIFGRLRAGITLERAEPEIESLAKSAYVDLLRQSPESASTDPKWVFDTRFGLERIANGVSVLRPQFREGLLALMVGVGLLLIMACANVAGLLLARSAARGPEMGIRLALGASRWRVVRQLLSESLPLALLGGIAGVLLTYACVPLLVGAIPPIRDRMAVLQPLAIEIDTDVRVLAFAVAITLLSVVLFGLSPALAGARTQIVHTLRSGRTATRRLSIQKLIVVAQVATCTLLLLSAALLVETLAQMRSMDPGFDADRVVTFTIDPRMQGYRPDQTHSLNQQLLERIRALPSVEAASIAGKALMRGTGLKGSYAPVGKQIRPEDFLNSSINHVTPEYFETMGMRLIAGRHFDRFDENEETPRKVIVNQELAKRFFPNQDPIGQFVGNAMPGGVVGPDMEIIGVVGDAKYRSLREEIQPTVYRPLTLLFETVILHVRTTQRPEAVIEPVRSVLRSLDPEMPFVEIHTLRQELEASLWQERLLAALSSIFGVIAVLLAGIGLYGALDYVVKARTREIGVRAALGAEPSHIARLLWSETLVLVGSGVALGFVAHATLAGWIRQVFYDVHPWNTAAVSSALLIVTLAVTLASLPPILRAIRIDPASALRQE